MPWSRADTGHLKLMKLIYDIINYNTGLFTVILIVAVLSTVAWACDEVRFRKNRKP